MPEYLFNFLNRYLFPELIIYIIAFVVSISLILLIVVGPGEEKHPPKPQPPQGGGHRKRVEDWALAKSESEPESKREWREAA